MPGKLILLAAAATSLAAAPASVRAQCPDGNPPPCGRAAAPRPRVQPLDSLGIAVLYLGSRDTAEAALADGLTEEIIARLSRVRGLRAASRHASLRYRGRPADPRQVGPQLGTRYVLDGTLRRSGDRLRISLAVTDAVTGYNVWGRTFERPVSDIFSIEDSVATQVAEALLGRLSPGDRRLVAPAAASASGEAYEAFPRGQVAIRSRRADAAGQAVAAYREALRLDPRFARAWAALAHALTLAAEWGWDVDGLSPDSLDALGSAAAARAVELDSTSAESWLAAGMATRRRDAGRALRLHHRAVASDSSSVEALHQLAWAHALARQLDSTILIQRRVIARDPYYAYAYAGLAEMLVMADQPVQALDIAARGLAIDSAIAPLHWHQSVALLRLGRAAEAAQALERADQLGAGTHATQVMRAILRLRQGDTASVRSQLAALERDYPSGSRGGRAFTFVWPLSALQAQLGDAGAAVRWASPLPGARPRAYAVVFQRHWIWERVRQSAEFQSFLASLEEPD